MIERIEVYVRTEDVITGQAMMGNPVHDGLATHYCTMRETGKAEKVMSQADRLVLEVVKDFAESRGLEVQVCDVSTFKGKLQARSKGIKATPAVNMGSTRIEGEQATKLSKNELESFFKE